MKKLKNLFIVAAMLSLTALVLGCDPAPETPATPDTPTYVGTAVTSEAEMVAMFTELGEELAEYFKEEKTPETSRAIRAAATTSNVDTIMEFIGGIAEDLGPFIENGSDVHISDKSLNISNLTAEEIIAIIAKFTTKKDGTSYTADEAWAIMAEEYKVPVDQLKAKFNDALTVTKLKFKAENINLSSVFDVRINEYENDYYVYNSTYVIAALSNADATVGVEVQNLDEMMKLISGKKESFPLKKLEAEVSVKAENVKMELPVGGSSEGGQKDDDFEEMKDYLLAQKKGEHLTQSEMKLDGSFAASTKFDVVTSKSNYNANVELSLNIVSTTALLNSEIAASSQNFESEEAEMAAMVASYNKFGSVTVKTSNNGTATFSKEYKLGDLYKLIYDAIKEAE